MSEKYKQMILSSRDFKKAVDPHATHEDFKSFVESYVKEKGDADLMYRASK